METNPIREPVTCLCACGCGLTFVNERPWIEKKYVDMVEASVLHLWQGRVK